MMRESFARQYIHISIHLTGNSTTEIHQTFCSAYNQLQKRKKTIFFFSTHILFLSLSSLRLNVKHLLRIELVRGAYHKPMLILKRRKLQ